MEGFLPSPWWQIWWIVSALFVVYGIYRLKGLIRENREVLPLLAVSGAFVFVLSSLKLPSVTGSSSHPTGTGLAAILFGPAVTAVLSVIVLLYQSLFLAHGGLSTLGANVFSMGIAGPAIGYAVYRLGLGAHMPPYLTVFTAAALADLTTYCVTAGQLALAFPAASGGYLFSFSAFLTVFAVTQVPLAIIEGAITALIFKYILQVRSDIVVRLRVIPDAVANRLREEAS
jgi:cobalt/nickel transport system permease protein